MEQTIEHTWKVGEGGFAAGEAHACETGFFRAGGGAGPEGGAGGGCAEECCRHDEIMVGSVLKRCR